MSSVGEQDVETIHGAVYPPQVALVGSGVVTQRLWAGCPASGRGHRESPTIG